MVTSSQPRPRFASPHENPPRPYLTRAFEALAVLAPLLLFVDLLPDPVGLALVVAAAATVTFLTAAAALDGVRWLIGRPRTE